MLRKINLLLDIYDTKKQFYIFYNNNTKYIDIDKKFINYYINNNKLINITANNKGAIGKFVRC